MDPLTLVGALVLATLGIIFALWMGISSARLDEERERTAGSNGPGSNS